MYCGIQNIKIMVPTVLLHHSALHDLSSEILNINFHEQKKHSYLYVTDLFSFFKSDCKIIDATRIFKFQSPHYDANSNWRAIYDLCKNNSKS